MLLIISASSCSGEVNVPYTLHCGGFQKALQDSVLWLSSGGTRSVLHYDGMDNFNCVLDGEKTVLLFDTVSILLDISRMFFIKY